MGAGQDLNELLKNHDNSSKVFESWKGVYSRIGGNESKFRDAVVTTNYDVLVEQSLKKKYIYSNYIQERILVLKLHGSINWFRLVPGELVHEDFNYESPIDSSYMNEEVLDYIGDTRLSAVDARNTSDNPIIVPPIVSKKYKDPIFRRIWWMASQVLRDSEELVILGYSFSNHDFYVRKLIDLAINGTWSNIQRVIHFDINPIVGKLFENKENSDKNFVPIKRKITVNYKFVQTDFSKEYPNLDDLDGPLIKI